MDSPGISKIVPKTGRIRWPSAAAVRVHRSDPKNGRAEIRQIPLESLNLLLIS
jgi:hypothetical protein